MQMRQDSFLCTAFVTRGVEEHVTVDGAVGGTVGSQAPEEGGDQLLLRRF